MTAQQEIDQVHRQLLRAKYPGNYGMKAGVIRLNPETGRYPSIMKFKHYEEVLLNKGLKKFEVNGQVIIALNKKNAIRKYKQQNNK